MYVERIVANDNNSAFATIYLMLQTMQCVLVTVGGRYVLKAKGSDMEQMWSACHPRTEEELIECATLGKSLNRLSQPTILTILAANNKPMHGYIIVQQAGNSPMFGGKKPDGVVFHIYSELQRRDVISDVCGTIKNIFPYALYMGCSTSGNIMNGAFYGSDITIVSATMIYFL